MESNNLTKIKKFILSDDDSLIELGVLMAYSVGLNIHNLAYIKLQHQYVDSNNRGTYIDSVITTSHSPFFKFSGYHYYIKWDNRKIFIICEYEGNIVFEHRFNLKSGFFMGGYYVPPNHIERQYHTLIQKSLTVLKNYNEQ